MLNWNWSSVVSALASGARGHGNGEKKLIWAHFINVSCREDIKSELSFRLGCWLEAPVQGETSPVQVQLKIPTLIYMITGYRLSFWRYFHSATLRPFTDLPNASLLSGYFRQVAMLSSAVSSVSLTADPGALFEPQPGHITFIETDNELFAGCGSSIWSVSI